MPKAEVSDGVSIAYDTFGEPGDPPVLLVIGFGLPTGAEVLVGFAAACSSYCFTILADIALANKNRTATTTSTQIRTIMTVIRKRASQKLGRSFWTPIRPWCT